MSVKTKKLMNQDSRDDYGNEKAEGATAISQGDDEFDGADNKFDEADDEFEEARAEEKAFDTARVDESMARARSQRGGNLAGYATGTANNPEEDKEEENAEGNHKQPARNPVGISHGWAEYNAAKACSQRTGNLSGYATVTTNDPEEDEEEENAAGNHKQPARKPVGGSHGWGN